MTNMKQFLISILFLVLFLVGLSQAINCKTYPIDQDGVISTLDDRSFYITCEFTTDDNECQLRHYYDGRENVFTSNNENSFSLRKNAITTYFCYNYLLMILQFSEDNVSIFMLTTLWLLFRIKKWSTITISKIYDLSCDTYSWMVYGY